MVILAAIVNSVIIGTGTGNAVAPVIRIAATRALQYLRANGIPDGPLPGTQWSLHDPPIHF